MDAGAQSAFVRDGRGAGGWLPFAQGQGYFLPPGFYLDAAALPGVTGYVDRISGAVQSFPLVPPPPPYSGVGAGPRVNYTSVHASFIAYLGDGLTMARWISGGNASGSTALAETRFSATDLNVTDPYEYGRLPMGINIIHSEVDPKVRPPTGQVKLCCPVRSLS